MEFKLVTEALERIFEGDLNVSQGPTKKFYLTDCTLEFDLRDKSAVVMQVKQNGKLIAQMPPCNMLDAAELVLHGIDLKFKITLE